MTAGYSGTPLAKKLGIKAGCKLHLIDAPKGYGELLEPLPESVRFMNRASASTNIVQVFVTQRSRLQRLLNQLRATLGGETVVWVSWPKKAARIATDITEDTVRELAMPLGYVDVKVCAVDAVWSGLKLVVRKELREDESIKRKGT